MVADDLHALSNGHRQQSTTRFNHHHHQKVQHGMQHSLQTMGMHNAQACHRCNSFSQTQFPEKNSGRLPIYLTEFVQEGVKKVPLRKRHTQQKLAALMGVSKTTLHHWIVASTICVHCNSPKPILTEENKWAR